jgi:integrase
LRVLYTTILSTCNLAPISRIDNPCFLSFRSISLSNFAEGLPSVFPLALAGLRPYTKTKRPRPLPILPEAAWLFATPGQGYVFTYGGKPYRHHELNTRWNKAIKKAGVRPIHLYNGVRHSWAMRRLNVGFSFSEVQAVLGQTDPKMTRGYAKVPTGEVDRCYPRGLYFVYTQIGSEAP